ncbi:MAG: restriction endonuclease subunit S [Flavobacteriales bacterium]|nr:restriction endonuclease subunit S [Flavobacteriales bacterium]
MELVESKYKQTEVGLIPEDWELVDVRDLLDLLTDYDANGSFASVAENVTVFDHPEYAWYVRSTDLENDTNIADVRYVDRESYKFLKKTALFGGELLFLKRGDIGKVYLFKMQTKFATVAPNLYLLKINQHSTPRFLYFFFSSRGGQLQLLSKNASSTLGALYKDDVKSIKVPLPPTLTEQRAIATALSDVDDLIQSLSKLIEKKKAIKQGVMQELLKPKENWIRQKLGDRAILKARIGWQGLTTAEYLDSGEYGLITGTDFVDGFIDWDNCVFVEKTRYDQDRNIQVREGDVLITKDGTIGKVAYIDKVKHPTTLNSGVFVLRPINNSFHTLFFYYLLLSDQFNDFLAKLAAGSTISHLYQKDFVNFRYWLPSSLAEQKLIAESLYSLDRDIDKANRTLKKYKDLKQGMMQELLTGKTRLI